MGNAPSGIRVTRHPTEQLETYNYTFDLNSYSDSQINAYFIKPLRKKKVDIHYSEETKKLQARYMTPPVFEELFRPLKPTLTIMRSPHSSFSEPS